MLLFVHPGTMLLSLGTGMGSVVRGGADDDGPGDGDAVGTGQRR